jgi:transcriptional regulator with XRE-family HTH domain
MTMIAFIMEAEMARFDINDPSSLGVALRKTRKSLKISQEDLSLQTGISRTTIRAIEQGKQTAHLGLVLQLCRDLGMVLVANAPDREERHDGS